MIPSVKIQEGSNPVFVHVSVDNTKNREEVYLSVLLNYNIPLYQQNVATFVFLGMSPSHLPISVETEERKKKGRKKKTKKKKPEGKTTTGPYLVGGRRFYPKRRFW